MKKISINITRVFLLIMFVFLVNSNVVYAEEFGWPLKSGESKVSSPMYDRTGDPNASNGYHLGWDFGGSLGENIYASASGRVVRIGEVAASDAGNFIVLEHQLSEDFVYDGINYGKVIYTRYLHMNSPSAFSIGDTVAKDTVVGAMGGTGKKQNSYDVHLHFDILSSETGGSSISKKVNLTSGKGVGKHTNLKDKWKKVYTVMYSNDNSLKAAFSPEIVIGKDIVVPQSTNASTVDGISIGSTIIPKKDIEKALELSSDLVSYGKLSGLEKTARDLKNTVKSYGKIISACLVFISTILIGVSIIFKRNNAEERMLLMTSLMGVGIGSLIVALATYIVDLAIK